jgi:hypothetical protein
VVLLGLLPVAAGALGVYVFKSFRRSRHA